MTDSALRADHRALTTGCGLLRPDHLVFVELTGADRARFLHGLVTCPVQGLSPGTGSYGFFTSPKGRILADVTVLVGEESLGLVLPAEAEGSILEHVGRYVVADRVEPRRRPELAPLVLAGPGAEGLAAELGAALPPGAWAHRRAEVAGIAATVVAHLPEPVPRLTLWVERERRDELAGALLDGGGDRGPVVAVGEAAWDALRVERGVPRFGRDFSVEHLPQETGLSHAVDFEKGCYLGQEVVARIHYRGKVNRILAGLLLAEDADGALPAPGTELRREGAAVGVTGTAARCPGLTGPRAAGPGAGAGGVVPAAALATVHRKAAAPGARLELASGGTAEVAELPLT